MNPFRISNKGAVGVFGMTLLAGCGGIQDVDEIHPNILWIILDDARADVLGSYGATWATTPNIDRLAEEGVRFHNAIIQNPVCIPSRNSMKTGYYAYETGPVEMGRIPEVEGDYIDRERMERLNEGPTLPVMFPLTILLTLLRSTCPCPQMRSWQ